MNKLGRFFAWLVVIPLLPSTTSGQAFVSAARVEAVLDPVACRLSEIYGGQNDTGAILTPMRDQPTPLRLFKIATAPDRASLQVELVSLTGSETLFQDDPHRVSRYYERMFWTSKDDFVIWRDDKLWWSGKDEIQAGTSPRIEYKADPYISPHGPSKDHVVREHGPVAAYPADRYVVEFDPQRPTFDYVRVRGPQAIAGLANQDFAWITDRVFGALSLDLRGRGKALEIYEDDKWKLFSPLWLTKDAKLLLFRTNPRDGTPEAIVRLREKEGVETISIVRRDSAKAEIIAVGSFEKIFVSPDRTRLYGYMDSSGRFHRIKSEVHPAPVTRWLTTFETMSGLEKFYFLEKGRYAFVKGARATGGTGVMILERQGDNVRVAYELCVTQPATAKVVAGEGSYLFVPKSDDGKMLIVYFHDQPLTPVDNTGDWLIDVLSQTGKPVLAINYGAETSRAEATPGGGIVQTWGNQFERGVQSALKALGSRDRKVILVGSGFGPLVGFAAINGGKTNAAALIAVSGLLEPRRVFKTYRSDIRPDAMTSLSRLARQPGLAPDEKALVKTAPALRLHFIHGSKDEEAPYQEVAEFVQRFNALAPARPVILSTIEGMEHTPATRGQYDAVIEAIENSINAP